MAFVSCAYLSVLGDRSPWVFFDNGSVEAGSERRYDYVKVNSFERHKKLKLLSGFSCRGNLTQFLCQFNFYIVHKRISVKKNLRVFAKFFKSCADEMWVKQGYYIILYLVVPVQIISLASFTKGNILLQPWEKHSWSELLSYIIICNNGCDVCLRAVRWLVKHGVVVRIRHRQWLVVLEVNDELWPLMWQQPFCAWHGDTTVDLRFVSTLFYTPHIGRFSCQKCNITKRCYVLTYNKHLLMIWYKNVEWI